MANITISNLPPRNTVLDTTEFATQTGFITERITGQTLKNYVASGLGATDFLGNIVVEAPYGVIATFVNAATIGNTNSVLTGQLSTGVQPNIISVGTLVDLRATGTMTLNGTTVHSEGSNAKFAAINSTPIGNATPSTGAFTTINATSAVVNGQLDAIRGGFNTIDTTTLNIRSQVKPSSNVNADLGNSGAWFRDVYARTGYFEKIESSSIALTNASLDDITVTNLTIGSSLVPTANVTTDIGSSTNWFRNIYGRAIHAQYADLAEKYIADGLYDVGTVVCIGGTDEITVSNKKYDTRVYGVISKHPSYVMNSALHNGATVGLKGRLPCKVIGSVHKGDSLVNAGDGYAMRLEQEKYKPGCVIGMALEDKITSEPGVIEIVLTKF